MKGGEDPSSWDKHKRELEKREIPSVGRSTPPPPRHVHSEALSYSSVEAQAGRTGGGTVVVY